MARKSESDRLKEIHARAMRRLDDAYSPVSDVRDACYSDRQFATIPGSTWEGLIGEQFKNRPKLEMSTVPREVRRLISAFRGSRIDVRFLPRDGGSDELVDACNGAFRADSKDSCSEDAMDNAYTEGVTGGFGAWRLTNALVDEEDEDSDHQRIQFEPIYEADRSVFFDPNSKKLDKSDARFAFVLHGKTRDAFEEDYPGWTVASIERNVQTLSPSYSWVTPDEVTIAEYFEVSEASETIVTFRDIAGEEEKVALSKLGDDDFIEREAKGTFEVSRKRVKKREVRKYIMSGADIMDVGAVPGGNIPIVPFYAERQFIDGVEWCWGMVRHARDAVQLKNMMISSLAYIAATGGTDKPIFTPEQMVGHSDAWANDAVDNNAYLLTNVAYDQSGTPIVGPVGMKTAPTIPPTLAALIQQASADVEDILGNQARADQYNPQMSGVAVEMVQNRIDGLSGVYMDNFANAEKRAGQIWLGMAAEVYADDDRVLRVIGESGAEDFVDMSEMTLREGSPVKTVDFSRAKFDVVSDVGPASSTRRASTVRALSEVLPAVQDPQDRLVLVSAIMQNIEGEGLSNIREYFRKRSVAIGAQEPTEADIAEAEEAAQGAAPDPQAQYIEAAAQQAQAQAMESQADAEEAIANAELKRAQTIKALSEVDTEQQAQAVETAKAIHDVLTNPPQTG